VRVTTAFKRLLRLSGASVIVVSFTGDGVVVIVRLRRRRRVCSAFRPRPAGCTSMTAASSAGGTSIWA
jgi:hypothetical protein